jgi:hypothetical protein
MSILPIPQTLIPPGQELLFRAIYERILQASENAGSETVSSSSGARNYSGSHAQRLSIPANSLPIGTTFYEEDRAVWYEVVASGVNARYWRPSRGTMRAVLANAPTDLGAQDAGFLFYATNYYRLYRWTGSAWTYADSELPEKFITTYPGTVPTGWALCDGSSVTVSKSDGTTQSFTTPDLTGQYIKGGTYTGSVVAAVAPTVGGTLGDAGSGAAVAVTVSGSVGAASGSTTVQSGGGASVASSGHTHSFSGSGSGTVSDDHTHDASALTVTDGDHAHVLLLPVVKL